MKSKIEKFLKFYNLLDANKTFAVGFSGGFDSMSLLHCLKDLSTIYGFKLVATHLNHNWRGNESKAEELVCQNFCKDLGIEFYTETLDENEKHTETRARELRYKFFDKVIQKFNVDALFTAHTKSDTAETLIYRIIKGTGIKGLQGISPKLGKIYRPLLEISRSEIENYCEKNLLKPNNDSSNANNYYARNFIRNKILPQFKEINPKVENALNSLSQLAFDNEIIVQEYIKSFNLYENDKIKTNVFSGLSKTVQTRIVYEIFVKYDIEYSRQKIENALNFINEKINSKSGRKYSLDKNLFLFVSSKFIQVISNQEKNLCEINITKEGSYRFENYELVIEKCSQIPNKFPDDKEFKAYVEIKEPLNFVLRTRRNGDIIIPFGQNSHIKFKKYLINKNIPQHEKDSIILLCKGSEIFWASGLGLSDKLKVEKKCTHVLTLYKRE